MARNETITGNIIIDELQGLQRVIDGYDDFEAKLERVRQGIHLVGAHSLLEQSCLVVAHQALGKSEDDAPEDRMLYQDGLMFTASLDAFSYLFDRDIPIDSLSCNFRTPDLLEAQQGPEVEAFQRLTLQVPVLAIETLVCVENPLTI